MRQYESFSEYTDEVCAQVRLKQARPEITAELTAHMEEQAQAYEAEGIPQSEAMRKAIADMGDPVITGGQLDATHRPKADKKLLLFAGLMIAVAVVMQLVITRATNYYIGLAVGVGVCIAMYYFDYTLISRLCWLWYTCVVGFIAFYFLYSNSGFFSFNNTINWVGYAAFLLIVPAYCGVLYSMRNKGYTGIFICCAALLLPVLLIFCIPFFGVAISVGICCFTILFWLIAKDWFGDGIKRIMVTAILSIIALVLLIAVFTVIANRNSDAYNMFRDEMAQGIRGVQFLGHSTSIDGEFLDNFMSSFNTEFTLFNIAVRWGIMPAILIIIAVAVFTVIMFRISRQQKNSFARILTFGCALIYALQNIGFIILNISGFYLFSFYPFLYSTSSMAIVNMAILGLFLSACKWNGIVSEKTLFAKRQRVKT